MSRLRTAIALATAAVAVSPASAAAQTDYYNTDRGRPLQVEDAYPVERRAFELQAAPLRMERTAGGAYHWSIEPEIAFGILPRTQLELGVPLSFVDASPARRSGISGVDVSVLYNLNVETAIPAFAIAGGALLPVGGLAGDETYVSVRGIATRTLEWARFHLNAEYTVGAAPPATAPAVEATRWMAGLAVDRTFPLRSLLVGGEVVAQRPLDAGADVVLTLGTGLRYQLTPRWAVDGGIGRRLTGDEHGWYITVGSAYAFGLPWYPGGPR